MAKKAEKATKPEKLSPQAEVDAIEAALSRLGFADWAVVAVKPDGARRRVWAAGDGQERAKDEDRIGRLMLGMRLLERDMEGFLTRDG